MSSHSWVRAYLASCTSNGAPYCAASSFHQDETTLSDSLPGAIVSSVDRALAASDAEWSLGRTASIRSSRWPTPPPAAARAHQPSDPPPSPLTPSRLSSARLLPPHP